MQQRVSIARALAYRPALMLMDEPFASVDAQTRGDLEDLVLRVRDEHGMTILLVTHDIDESVYLADRVLVLSTAPTTIVETLKVGLPRERDQITTRESDEFVHLRGEVARLLKHNELAQDAANNQAGISRLRGYVGTLEVSRIPPRRPPVPDGPLIVQSDKTLLLEIDHPLANETRVAIAPFAELERAPEHVHTYRVTPLALWNARAAGHDAEQVVDALVRYSPVPGATAAAGRRRRHHGPVRPAATGQRPRARPGDDHHRPRRAGRGPAQQEDRADARRPHRRRHRHRAPERARHGSSRRC